jgi:hypothetical protein
VGRTPDPADGSGAVVVAQTGWSQQAPARNYGLYSWGVVIANRSTTQDAVGVIVTVTLYARGFGELDSRQIRVAVVPAGQRFGLGDGEGSFAHVRITSIHVAVQVGWMQPKHVALPHVWAIRLDRGNDSIAAVTTNPYDVPINLDNASGFLVAFDRTGQIIGGANTDLLYPERTNLPPHAPLPVDIPLFAIPMGRVDRVRISINP